ncbi:hypothetical protein BGZ70_001239 [Mortierella alpina]|uniref:Uncharacterized protein n=1 Tax=Mortierella alpina TaxID=64518 RepID=A0A9P6IW95_MORAP|nr:hypothetical protein BGZ70_001239 [Mortierella alpina]
MSPVIIHFKSSKRKTLQSMDFLLETEMYQKDADGHGQEKTVDDITLQEHRRKSLPAGWKRQVVLESITILPDMPTMTATYTASNRPTIAPPTATATATQKPEGQAPLSSIAVQLVLGMLAGVGLIAVFLRCFYVSRQHHAFIDARRRNLRAAHAQAALHASARRGAANGTVGGTHLVPTNEMTLAGRLNMYQARSGSARHHYPYQQEVPRTGALESASSFVAPSYEHDVSPPPFLTASGKPPAYAEVVNIGAQPTPIPLHSTLSTPPPHSAHANTSQGAE